MGLKIFPELAVVEGGSSKESMFVKRRCKGRICNWVYRCCSYCVVDRKMSWSKTLHGEGSSRVLSWMEAVRWTVMGQWNEVYIFIFLFKYQYMCKWKNESGIHLLNYHSDDVPGSFLPVADPERWWWEPAFIRWLVNNCFCFLILFIRWESFLFWRSGRKARLGLLTDCFEWFGFAILWWWSTSFDKIFSFSAAL